MRILCFGGSFNPIHYGHLIVAQAVAEAAGFDQVLLIPSAQPPHKIGHAQMASAADRLTMCQIATKATDRFAVSDIELRRSEPSFTIETARALRREGHSDVFWLIGSDTVSQLKHWREPEALLREVQFVVAGRGGVLASAAMLEPPYRQLLEHQVAAPLIEISATDIRQRVGAGKSIDFHTPPAVAAYIREKGLYRL